MGELSNDASHSLRLGRAQLGDLAFRPGCDFPVWTRTFLNQEPLWRSRQWLEASVVRPSVGREMVGG
jgi:hypothetical protein